MLQHCMWSIIIICMELSLQNKILHMHNMLMKNWFTSPWWCCILPLMLQLQCFLHLLLHIESPCHDISWWLIWLLLFHHQGASIYIVFAIMREIIGCCYARAKLCSQSPGLPPCWVQCIHECQVCSCANILMNFPGKKVSYTAYWCNYNYVFTQ